MDKTAFDEAICQQVPRICCEINQSPSNTCKTTKVCYRTPTMRESKSVSGHRCQKSNSFAESYAYNTSSTHEHFVNENTNRSYHEVRGCSVPLERELNVIKKERRSTHFPTADTSYFTCRANPIPSSAHCSSDENVWSDCETYRFKRRFHSHYDSSNPYKVKMITRSISSSPEFSNLNRHRCADKIDHINIPISYERVDSDNVRTKTLKRYSSLPTLHDRKNSWPSNITYITTRSIVRNDLPLETISETDVFDHSNKTTETNEYYSKKKHYRKHHRQERFEEELSNLEGNILSVSSASKRSPELSSKVGRLSSNWNDIMSTSKRFTDRLMLSDMVLSSLTDLLSKVTEFETRLTSAEPLISDVSRLKIRLSGLNELAAESMKHEGIIDALSRDLNTLKREIEKTRKHTSDVEKLEDTAQQVFERWENVRKQIIQRQRQTEHAINTLNKFNSLLAQENQWIRRMEGAVRNLHSFHLSSVVSVDSAKEAIKPAAQLFNDLVSHSSSLEHLNDVGVKFIQEARIHDNDIKQYKDSLLDVNPNIGAGGLVSKKMKGSSAVRKQLETINRQYADLLTICNDRIRAFTNAMANTGEPLSFHLTVQNAEPLINSYRSSIASRYQLSPFSTDESDVDETYKYSNAGRVNIKIENTVSGPYYSDMINSEGLRAISRCKYFKNPQTAKMYTLQEAKDIGMLDMRNQCLIEPKQYQKISINAGVQLGMIDSIPASILSRKGGFFVDGKELSFLEALDRGIIDLTAGNFVNGKSDPISVAEAYERGIVDSKGLKVLNDLVSYVESQEQVHLGKWISEHPCEKPLTLTDCIELRLIDTSNGNFINPTDGSRITLDEAMNRKYLASDVQEIIYSGSVAKLTLKEALERRIISPNGQLNDFNKALDLASAFSQKLIEKPLTLAELFVSNLIDTSSNVICLRTGKKISFAEAIGANIIDASVKHIIHPVTKNLLSVRDAQKINLINENGRFIDPVSGEISNLFEAVKANKLQLVTLKPTMKGALIKDRISNRLISLSEAMQRNKLVDVVNDQYVDNSSGRTMSISHAIEEGFILDEFKIDLMKCIGMHDSNGRPLNVLDVIKRNLVNFLNGTITNPINNKVYNFNDAISYGIISIEGAKVLNDLRGAITFETYLTSYISSPSDDDTKTKFIFKPAPEIEYYDIGRRPPYRSTVLISSEQDNIYSIPSKYQTTSPVHLKDLSFIDAVNQKLLNIDTGYLVHPVTGREISLMTAIKENIINPQTAFVVDTAAGRNYDIEEAVRCGLITNDNFVHDRRTNRYLSFAEAIKTGVLRLGDSSVPSYSMISKTESLSIRSVKDSLSGEFIEPNKAIKLKILDPYHGVYTDTAAGRKITIDDAISQGLILVDKIFDSSRNNRDKNIVSTSLIRETRSYHLLGVKDPFTGEEMTVQEAINRGILDRSKGTFYNKRTNECLSISDAINRGFIRAALVPLESDPNVLLSKRAVRETKTYTLKGAIDARTNQQVSIRKAIESGIIDQAKGLYVNLLTNETMPISLAVEKNYIITEVSDADSRTFIDREPTYTKKVVRILAIEQVLNPRTNRKVSVDEALKLGLIDLGTCSYYNPLTHQTLSLTQAFDKGFIFGYYTNERAGIPYGVLTARVVREERSYLVNSVLDIRNQSRVTLEEAITKGLIDKVRGVYVNPITSQETNLKDAIEKGYVDAELISGDFEKTHKTPSSMKIVRIQESEKFPVSKTEKSVAYELDMVEEFIETIDDKAETKAFTETPVVEMSEIRSAQASEYDQGEFHKVVHKERNVKERDITIQSVSKPQYTSKVEGVEEFVIDDHRRSKLVNIEPENRSFTKEVVIEDDKRKPSEHVIIIEERAGLKKIKDESISKTSRAAHDYREVRRSQKAPVTQPGVEEREVLHIDDYRPYVQTEEELIIPDSQKETYKYDIQEKRYEDTYKVSSVDEKKRLEQDKFIEEILDKAKDQQIKTATQKSYEEYEECTYVVDGMHHTITWVLEPETREKLTLREGINRNLLNPKTMQYHDTTSNTYYSIETAVKRGYIGTDEDVLPIVVNADGIIYTINWVLDPNGKCRIFPRRAVNKKILDLERLRYYNPYNNVSISIHEAVKMKFIGANEQKPDSSEMSVTLNGVTYVFSWVLDTIAHERVGAYEALKRGLIDISNCLYFKHDTGDVMTIADAIQSGYIGTDEDKVSEGSVQNAASIMSLDEDELTISTKTATYVITSVIHPVTQREMRVSEAIDLGILNKETGAYKDLNTGVVYELADAINEGLVYATIIETKETTEMETSSVKKVIQRYIVKTVIDPRNGKRIGGLQAQAAGILNYAQGMYSDPDTGRGIPIKEAIDKTLIDVELINQTSDEQFELDIIKDSLMERRVTIYRIYNVVDPVLEENITALEAVHRQILDSDTKTYFNAATGEHVELQDAIARGFIQADVKERVTRKPLRLSLQNAARLGFYNYDTGIFRDPYTEASMKLQEAIDFGHIHLNSIAIANTAQGPMVLRDALAHGIISRTTGKLDRVRLQTRKGSVTDSRIYRMNVEDAVRCGLLDLHTGLYKHPHTGERLVLKEAISRGLLDGETLIIEHPITRAFVTLRQALDTINIDNKGSVIDRYSGKEISNLEKEFNQRRLFSIFDTNTGEVFLMNTGEKISFEKAVRKNKLDSHFRIFDFNTNREYSIQEAIERGIIDKDSGRIFDSTNKESMSIREAIRRGHIAVVGAPVVPIKADHDALTAKITSRKRRRSSRTRSGGDRSDDSFDDTFSFQNVDRDIDRTLTSSSVSHPSRTITITRTVASNSIAEPAIRMQSKSASSFAGNIS